ncbi:DNA repair protein XRCC3-like [Saccoglossus kowalevskii]
MDVNELELHPRILDAIKRAKLTVEKTLCLSAADLSRLTKLSTSDVGHLLYEVSKSVPRIPMAIALDIKEERCHASLKVRYVKTGCEVLDDFLRGGILSQGITEIAGESAAGKTQLCMQLCLTVQLPCHMGGLAGGAVYICTEDVFPSKRLHQMIKYFNRKLGPELEMQLAVGDHIFVEHASDQESLWKCINQRVPVLLARGMVKFIVIDSIAALFRGEYDFSEAAKRAHHLRSFGDQLRKLNQQYNAPVVCVNQVSANMKGDSEYGRYEFIPALGLSWSNLVTCRLLLSRTSMTIDINDPDTGNNAVAKVRTMEAMFAPHLPRDLCYYVVDAKGVHGLR